MYYALLVQEVDAVMEKLKIFCKWDEKLCSLKNLNPVSNQNSYTAASKRQLVWC